MAQSCSPPQRVVEFFKVLNTKELYLKPSDMMIADVQSELEAAKGILPRLNSVQKQYWSSLYEDEHRKLAGLLERLQDEDRRAAEYVLHRYLSMVVMAVGEVVIREGE